MPPKKGKRGPKKGAKTASVPEEVDKTEDTVDVKADEEPLEEVQVDSGLEVDMEVQDEFRKMDVEDAGVDPRDSKLDQDKVEDKEVENVKSKPSFENLETVVDLNKSDGLLNGRMDNFNVDLDVEGSSPEMMEYTEPEPVHQKETVQDFTVEELNQCLKEMTNAFLLLSQELEQLEEEEEEGAIKEDEVPFDRFPEVPEPSTVLLVLNLPPELDNDKAVKVFTSQSALVTNATFVNKTQMRVHFKTQKAATAAKNTLDNLKLYNRKLQVLYARDIVHGHLPAHMNFPYNISPNEFPERTFNKQQKPRTNFNEFNVPPPPTAAYTGPPQDRHKVVFNRYKLANNTLYKILMEYYHGLASDTTGSVLRWNENRSFYENLLRFDRMYEKVKVSTRYLLLGNLPSSLLDNSKRLHKFLARFTNTTYTFEVVKLPYSYPEKKVESGRGDYKDQQEWVDNQGLVKDEDDLEMNEKEKENLENELGSNKDKELEVDMDMEGENMDKETLEENKEQEADKVEDKNAENVGLGDKGQKRWLFLVFDKNRDAATFYSKFLNSVKFFREKISAGGNEKDDPDGLRYMFVRYSCPLHPLDTLWIGNVTDLCAYFSGEDELYSFFTSLGNVKYFKLVYESSCMFVTFQETETSTKVYNFLNAMSPKRVVKLYNLRNKNRNSTNSNKEDGSLDAKKDMDMEVESSRVGGLNGEVKKERGFLQKDKLNLDVVKVDREDAENETDELSEDRESYLREGRLDREKSREEEVVDLKDVNKELEMEDNKLGENKDKGVVKMDRESVEEFLDAEKTDDLLNVDFSIGRADSSYLLGQKLLNAIKRRSDSKELIENLLNINEYAQFSRDQENLARNGRQYRREYPEVWRRERGRFDRRFREPYGREMYDNRVPYGRETRDTFGGENRDSSREHYGKDSREARDFRDGREMYGRDAFGREGRPGREENRYMNEGYGGRDSYGRDSRGPYGREGTRDSFGRDAFGREARDTFSRDGKDSYLRENRDFRDMSGKDREYNRFRQRYPINKETRVDKFGRTIRPYDRSRRDDVWKGGKYPTPPPPPRDVDVVKRVNPLLDQPLLRDSDEFGPPPPSGSNYDGKQEMDMEVEGSGVGGLNERVSDVKEPPSDKVEYCKLLKRGKYICTVNAKFVRGDSTCRLPELLDVNQRANPERLKNCLSKSSELSLWKLGADTKEDEPKYESLCEYLISKNRVALVQEGPFDVYIVPPHHLFENMLNTPDSDFMYAYLLPRAP